MTNRTKVMAKDVILTFYVTLTFDLGHQKFIGLSIRYNMRQVGSLYDKWNKSYGQRCYFNLLHDLDLHFDLGCQNFWPFHRLQYETSWKSVCQIEQKLWPKMFF